MGVLRRPRKVFPSSFTQSSKFSNLLSSIKLPRHGHGLGFDSIFNGTCKTTQPVQDKHEKQEKAEEEKKEVEKPADEAEKAAPASEEKAEKVEEKNEEDLIVIELKVDMHCEGCARKVKKALSTIPGVGGVHVDIQNHKVLVKAKPAVDVLHVKERVQKKSGRKTELISPIPPPPKEEDAKPEENKEEEAKPEEKPQPEPEKRSIVVLKVRMHCENCASDVRRAFSRIKGVETATCNISTEEVTVTAKGTVDASRLAEHFHKKTAKHAVVVSHTTEDVKTEESPSTDGKPEEKDNKGEQKPDGEEEGAEADSAGAEKTEAEVLKNEEPAGPRYVIEYIHPPQLFSDENPNACSIM